MKKKIKVETEIQTYGKYCGMNCPFLGKGGYCILFGKFSDLKLKKSKKHLRWYYVRCPECLKAEE